MTLAMLNSGPRWGLDARAGRGAERALVQVGGMGLTEALERSRKRRTSRRGERDERGERDSDDIPAGPTWCTASGLHKSLALDSHPRRHDCQAAFWALEVVLHVLELRDWA